MLCSSCREIFKKPEFFEYKTSVKGRTYAHSKYTKSVRDASLDGCLVCAILCLHFDVEPEHCPLEELDLRYWIGHKDGMKVHEFSSYSELKIKFIYEKKRNDWKRIKYLYLQEDKDIVPFLCNDSDMLPTSTSSAESWKQASTWMKECLEGHIQCNQILQGVPWWPSRLLDVQVLDGKTDIRLIETGCINPLGAYMTLSHRWGNAQFIKLTKKNLDSLKAGISMKDLPGTFRDAVFVTRRLKTPYLWIDSLCIIQDSIEDWDKEASQMSEVYRHAICNIAATGALDSTKGLFFNKDPSTIQPCRVQVPLRQPSTEFRDVYIVDPDSWEYRIQKAPLISRAWVVQERLLARRVLHFNQDQLYWECREQTACEIYPKRMPPLLAESGRFKDIFPKIELQYNASKGENEIYNSEEQIWSRILGCYSMAQLTKQEDKEVALSGIVKFLETTFHDTYIVGLWRKRLPFELLWECEFPARPCRTYRAPSWSWLSIDGKVEAFQSSSKYSLEYPSVDVEAIEITRASESPISPITSGFIKLRGRVRHVILESRSDRDMVWIKFYGQKDSGLIFYMDDSASSFNESAWLIQIHICKAMVSGKYYGGGLILRRNPDGVYQRIGYFHSFNKNPLNLLSRRRRAAMEGMEDTGEKSFAALSLQSVSERRDADADAKASIHELGNDEDDPEEESIIII